MTEFIDLHKPLYSSVKQVDLPLSKSICNRLLLLNALHHNPFEIEALSDADDTQLLNRFIQEANQYQGNGPVIFDCKNAGTSSRFLATYLANKKGNWIITGCDRLKGRPVKDLVDALIHCGAEISYMENEACLPIQIIGKKLAAKNIAIDMAKSSQFGSALLMLTSQFKEACHITLLNTERSMSYIQLTINIIKTLGIDIQLEGNKVHILPSIPQKHLISCETDWSSAIFWYAIAAIQNDTSLYLPKLKKNSFQGDNIIAEWADKYWGVASEYKTEGIIIKKKNSLKPERISLNFSDFPDLFLPFACCCSILQIELFAKGLESLKYKESNRLKALQNELKHFGISMQIDTNNNVYIPHSTLSYDGEIISTYGDHRIAMSMALFAFRFSPIKIAHPEVVEKSYKNFWNFFQL